MATESAGADETYHIPEITEKYPGICSFLSVSVGEQISMTAIITMRLVKF